MFTILMTVLIGQSFLNMFYHIALFVTGLLIETPPIVDPNLFSPSQEPARRGTAGIGHRRDVPGADKTCLGHTGDSPGRQG